MVSGIEIVERLDVLLKMLRPIADAASLQAAARRAEDDAQSDELCAEQVRDRELSVEGEVWVRPCTGNVFRDGLCRQHWRKRKAKSMAVRVSPPPAFEG